MLCFFQAEDCLATLSPISSVSLQLTATTTVSLYASAIWGGNYVYGQCQLIIDLVITCFPLRQGQLIYKANAKGEVSESVIHDLWLIWLSLIALFSLPTAFQHNKHSNTSIIFLPGE